MTLIPMPPANHTHTATGALLGSSSPFFAEAQRMRGGAATTDQAAAVEASATVPAAPAKDPAPATATTQAKPSKGTYSDGKARVTIRRKEDANKPPAHTTEELQQHPMPLQEMTLLVNKQQRPQQDAAAAVVVEPPVAPSIAVGEPNPSAPLKHPHMHHTHLDFERRATHGVEEEEGAANMVEEGGVAGDVKGASEVPMGVHPHKAHKKLTLKEFLLEFGEEGRKGKKPAAAAAPAAGMATPVSSSPAVAVKRRVEEEVEEAKDDVDDGSGERIAEAAAAAVTAAVAKTGGLRGAIQQVEASAVELDEEVKEASKRLRGTNGGGQQQQQQQDEDIESKGREKEDEEDNGPPGTPRTDRPPAGLVEVARKECTGGMVYSDCGRPCTATCEHPRPVCPAVCVPKCHCPSAKPVWDGDQCIEEKMCHLKGGGGAPAPAAPAKSLRGAK